MNHCLNCGAAREGDQCADCGLTTAAAEVLQRRRLLMLTAIFLVGAVTFLPSSQLYPPLELDAIFIFIGVVVAAGLTLAVIADRRVHRGEDVEMVRRVFLGLLPVPWLLAALLFVNGRFDPAPATVQVASVVGKFTMPGVLQSTRLAVTSWRPGRRIERIPLPREHFHLYNRGDVVEIKTQEGLVGIPWVSDVSRR
jgi:hypothetical protein